MRLHLPTFTASSSGVRCSYRVEYDRSYGLPEELWYEVPQGSPLLNERAEPSLVALIPLAMHLGEPLRICGPVSPKLLAGLQEWQSVFALWFPQWLRIVELLPETTALAVPSSQQAASSFSGGLDSFYTLRTNQGTLTHAILGGRMDVLDDAIYETLLREYRPLLAALGLTLLTARTNVRSLLDRVSWEVTHGAAVASLAHLFSPSLSRFLIAASYAYDALIPWGSHPLTDRMLSTETLEIAHHGADRSRGQKVQAICDWPATYRHLRVCWEHPHGLQNCGNCNKCVRTMIPLKLCAALERYETFPHTLTRAQVRGIRARRPSDWAFFMQNLELARATGHSDFCADLRHAYLESKKAAAIQSWRWRLQQLGRLVLKR